MGGRAGGGLRAGLGRDSGGNYTGTITNIEGIESIKDPQVRKAVYEAISRYESVIGIRQLNIKVADLNGPFGEHITAGGKSYGIFLDRATFNQTKKAFIEQRKQLYASGWSTKTNKPMAHTVTHELAHATWNSHLTGANALAASPAIKSLYNTWKADRGKRGYGVYAASNINEFWAETITKAVHGKSDRYTKAVKTIVKTYKL